MVHSVSGQVFVSVKVSIYYRYMMYINPTYIRDILYLSILIENKYLYSYPICFYPTKVPFKFKHLNKKPCHSVEICFHYIITGLLTSLDPTIHNFIFFLMDSIKLTANICLTKALFSLWKTLHEIHYSFEIYYSFTLQNTLCNKVCYISSIFIQLNMP